MSYSDYGNGDFAYWNHEHNYSQTSDGSYGDHHPEVNSSSFRVIDVEAAAKGENKLGLKLTKTPSLLKIMDGLKNSQGRKKQAEDSFASADKLKAANFSALSIQIGSWKRESRHEGDLVAKCYFKKRKLVWEILDGNLKTKIEFLWSNILAIRQRDSHADNTRILEIMLERSPLFFREINPQPRKHTNWEQADHDFTNNQASLIRKHEVEFAPGVLEKQFDKIIQADPKLHHLSQQPWPNHISPFFHEIRFTNQIDFDLPRPYSNYTPIALQNPVHTRGMDLSHVNSSNYCQTSNYPIHEASYNQNVSPYQNLEQGDEQNLNEINYSQELSNHFNHQSDFATSSSMDLSPMNQHVPYAQQQELSYETTFPYDGGYYQSNHDNYGSQYNYHNEGGNQW